MRQLIYLGHVYRQAADEPTPSVDKSVHPEQHHDEIMRSLREELGAPGQDHLGELSLIAPDMFNATGDAKHGYEIRGSIQTKLKFDKSKYGEPPYTFVAIIGVEEDDAGNLKESVDHVEIQGQK